MQIVRAVATAAFAWSLSLGQVQAEEPDILGTWSAETEILLVVEDQVVRVPRAVTVVFEEVDGQLLIGYRGWQALSDAPGNVAGAEVLGAKEPFIGVIDSDGVTLRFVETDDRGHMIGELLGPNALEFTYLETWPHAVAYTVVLERKTE